jgi:hypothetical protein
VTSDNLGKNDKSFPESDAPKFCRSRCQEKQISRRHLPRNSKLQNLDLFWAEMMAFSKYFKLPRNIF